MLAVASLKRSLQFDPVEQGVKRKRAEIKLPTASAIPLPNSPSKQQQQQQQPSIFTSSKSSIVKSSSFSSVTDNTPIFTHTQTAQRCAQLLREQDRCLREQYEQLLLTKLNEQYEQFIRYSQDNINKNSSKPKLFHFGQQQQQSDSDVSSSSIDFSYIS